MDEGPPQPIGRYTAYVVIACTHLGDALSCRYLNEASSLSSGLASLTMGAVIMIAVALSNASSSRNRNAALQYEGTWRPSRRSMEKNHHHSTEIRRHSLSPLYFIFSRCRTVEYATNPLLRCTVVSDTAVHLNLINCIEYKCAVNQCTLVIERDLTYFFLSDSVAAPPRAPHCALQLDTMCLLWGAA